MLISNEAVFYQHKMTQRTLVMNTNITYANITAVCPCFGVNAPYCSHHRQGQFSVVVTVQDNHSSNIKQGKAFINTRIKAIQSLMCNPKT